MKKILLGLALLASTALALAQAAPPASPPSVVVPDPIVGMLATIFASGLAMWKVIDGLKDMFKLSGTILKILNFAGNFLLIGGGCIVVGHVNEIGGVVGCFISAVAASLVSAGFYHGATQANIARAGGAAALTNAQAVAEVKPPAKP